MLRIKSLLRHLKNKAITKPSFPLYVIKTFIVLFVIALIIFYNLKINAFFDNNINLRKSIEGQLNVSAIDYYNSGDPGDLRYAEDAYMAAIISDTNVKIIHDGTTIVDTTGSYHMNSIFAARSYPYFGKWDSSLNDKYSSLYDYVCKNSYFYSYYFSVNDYYVNEETGVAYPGVVSVYKLGSSEGFSANEMSKPVIEKIDLTPDSSLIDGAEHIITKYPYQVLLHVTMPSDYVSPNGEDGSWYTDSFSGIHNVTYYNYENAHRLDVQFEIVVIAVAFVIIIAISFAIGAILYYRAKSVYEIFEYRRKTTEAMAHDLKTPLSVISLSAANLKEQLNSNPQKCIAHADKIENTISYANELIENILQFSKSEYQNRKLKVVSVDIKANVDEYLKTVESQLTSKHMAVNVTGEGLINTDKELWEQSVTNLINNAIVHSQEGSKISINISASGNEIFTISNPVSAPIDDPQKFLEPFVKGTSHRGDKTGSGLGLAIARNNLETLKYELSVECKDNMFIARISK